MSITKKQMEMELFSAAGHLLSQKTYYDTEFIYKNIAHLDIGNYFVRINDGAASQLFRFIKMSWE